MLSRSILPNCLECSVRRSSIFSDLKSDEVEKLECLKDAGLYKKGQTIFQEGNHPKGIFCIFAGKVKVFKLGSNYKEQIVRLAKEGDVIGYRSLICGDKYHASAATIEDSTICFIPREHLFKVLEDNAILSNNLMKLLSQDLAHAETKMVEMMQKPVRERLAEGIIMLKEMYGLMEDGKTLNVVMTREDIANFIGTTTETAIRILSDLNGENIIGLDKKKISIENFPKLLHESHIND
jgi:CRP/FNR family transcriptional regulator, polysaccharide utilization system transcription regulator